MLLEGGRNASMNVLRKHGDRRAQAFEGRVPAYRDRTATIGTRRDATRTGRDSRSEWSSRPRARERRRRRRRGRGPRRPDSREGAIRRTTLAARADRQTRIELRTGAIAAAAAVAEQSQRMDGAGWAGVASLLSPSVIWPRVTRARTSTRQHFSFHSPGGAAVNLGKFGRRRRLAVSTHSTRKEEGDR